MVSTALRFWHGAPAGRPVTIAAVQDPGGCQLPGGGDETIAAFFDEIDVRRPRDREMLRELARSCDRIV